jgi:hypothetical protein
MKNWEVVQVNLAQKGVLIDSPEGLFNWIEQIQLEGSSWQKLAEGLIVQQQQLMSLLITIVQDSEAAATSMMQELVMVDASIEQLDQALNRVKSKFDQLGSFPHSQLLSLQETILQQGLINPEMNESDVLTMVADCTNQLSRATTDMQNGIRDIVTLLSFKIILETSVAEDGGKSFAQIAGEVRNLARSGLTKADELHLLINELLSLLKETFTQAGKGFDVAREQLVVVQRETQKLITVHTELTTLFSDMTQVMRDANHDILHKTRMIYAQAQFQDIVRQKAERGVNLIQLTIDMLKALADDADMKKAYSQLQAAIVGYENTEALHVSFHHSGADISHRGGNMVIDLF